MFKWEDEALLDEIRMVDAKLLDLLHDVQTISKTLRDQLAVQDTALLEIKQDIASKVRMISEDTMMSMSAAESPNIVDTTVTDASANLANSPLRNFAAACVVLGCNALLSYKLN